MIRTQNRQSFPRAKIPCLRHIRHAVIPPLVLVALITAGLSSSGLAVVIRVKPDGSDGNDGSSWLLAKATVQASLEGAAAGDEVWVAAGTYLECVMPNNGVRLYGGFAGTETSRDQRDWTMNVTILDGNQQGSVVTVPEGATNATVIDGFTIRNGTGTDRSGTRYGGGIYCHLASPTISNVVMTNNGFGGYLRGGGLYCSGSYTYTSSVTISNCTITQNTAYDGAGIYLSYSQGTIVNNVITGNTSWVGDGGGGIYCRGVSGAGACPTIANNVITNNSANGGGGIYSNGAGNIGFRPEIAGNLIAGNTARLSGGGISCRASSPSITNNVITDNDAGTDGGAIAAFAVTTDIWDARPAIVGNTITCNSATRMGGAIFYTGWSLPGLVNNIVALNSSGIHAWYALTATPRNNCVYGNWAYDYSGVSPGPGDILADPQFADSAGGDFHLLATSPCIDTGDDSVVQPGSVDMDGEPRVMGIRVDIGADEAIAELGAAQLEVETWGPTRVSPGQTVTYTVRYRNRGNVDAHNVLVFIKLDDLVEVVGASAGYVHDTYANEVSWLLETVPWWSSGTLTIQARLAWGLPSNVPIRNMAHARIMMMTPLEGQALAAAQVEAAQAGAGYPNLHYTGINWESTSLTKNSEFASELSAQLVPTYMDTTAGTGAAHVLLARWGIATPQNGLATPPQEVGDVSAHSGGCRSLVSRIKDGSIIVHGDVHLLSPQGIPQSDLEEISTRVGGSIHVYQSAGDTLVPHGLLLDGFVPDWWIEYIPMKQPATETNIPWNGFGKAPRFINEIVGEVERVTGETVVWAKVDSTRQVWIKTVDASGTGGHYDTFFVDGEASRGGRFIATPRIQVHDCKWSHVDPETGYQEPVAHEAYPDWFKREVLKSSTCADPGQWVSQVAVARDPNEKRVSAAHALPGQRLDYVVEYENEGQGIAYGVYVIDQLDEHLDASSLSIWGGGTYDALTRIIMWQIGEVGPGMGASVGFSANSRGDAQSGTEVVNYATVYFPSVPEATRTNAVVTRIADVIAPTTEFVLGYPKHIDGATTYVSPVTDLTLLATDQPGGSGVAAMRYSVGGLDWVAYAEPFALADGLPDGLHDVFYRSEDLAGNVEEPRSAPLVLDGSPPASAVSPLASTQISPSFAVSWSGTDGGGSGVRDYTILVSDNGAPYVPWVSLTAAVSGTFTGAVGHTYGFYSVARDNVGNVEDAPAAPDAVTTVTVRQYFVEWLPPIKAVEQGYSYFMQDGSTLPIKVGLTDSGGAFADEPGLAIVVTDGAGDQVVSFDRSQLRIETGQDGRQYYMVNLRTKESGMVVGPTYYIRALVSGQQVGASVDLALASGGVAKGK